MVIFGEQQCCVLLDFLTPHPFWCRHTHKTGMGTSLARAASRGGLLQGAGAGSCLGLQPRSRPRIITKFCSFSQPSQTPTYPKHPQHPPTHSSTKWWSFKSSARTGTASCTRRRARPRTRTCSKTWCGCGTPACRCNAWWALCGPCFRVPAVVVEVEVARATI